MNLLFPSMLFWQNLLSFLEPLLKKSSEHRRNYAVIKNLIFRAHLQVNSICFVFFVVMLLYQKAGLETLQQKGAFCV